MQQLTRRGAISAIGLAGVSVAFAKGAKAASVAAPAVLPQGVGGDAQQGSGFYRFQVGGGEKAIACYSIGDGQGQMPPFPIWGSNASQGEVESVLESFVLPKSPVLMHFNVLCFRVGNETWLVDAGNGPGPRGGKLMTHLATLGIKPGDVSGIVVSHLHGDHFGGFFDEAGGLAFPNAKYFINKAEKEFWGGSPDLSKCKLPEDNKKGAAERAAKTIVSLEKSGKLQVVGDGDTLTTGVTVKQTGGHTPGHQTVTIESGGDKFTMLVDAAHHFALSFGKPDWHLAFDYDAEVGARTRRKVLEGIAAGRTLVMGYHTPWPGIGHVRARDGGFEWLPVPWSW